MCNISKFEAIGAIDNNMLNNFFYEFISASKRHETILKCKTLRVNLFFLFLKKVVFQHNKTDCICYFALKDSYGNFFEMHYLNKIMT